MKITIQSQVVNKKAPTVQVKDIPVGTYFKAVISNIPYLFLRIYKGIVSLDDPNQTWGIDCHVDQYKPLEVQEVILKVAK